ncbi:hypothetical protein LCGC14_2272810 [marine sediment metagenome]|uniref:Uncharacterized protein n=1 Tax=marine sediment metagenome TaxID=412755 RepID=A0A0F9FRN2_9ZZZZ
MSGRFLVNFTLGIHLVSAWGGAALGSYEVCTQRSHRYFSETNDELYTGSARGLVRGGYYPYKTLRHLPKVWEKEKPPWM